MMQVLTLKYYVHVPACVICVCACMCLSCTMHAASDGVCGEYVNALHVVSVCANVHV